MRKPATAETVRAFARALGTSVRGPARVYLVGGATAVLSGWRPSTADLDLRVEPDEEILRALVQLKVRLAVNVELASPADFLPELPGWRDRSVFLFREGAVDFFNYDLYSQVLAKLSRDLAHDSDDVAAMVRDGGVDPVRLLALFEQVSDQLYRFPAVEPDLLRQSVQRLISACHEEDAR